MRRARYFLVVAATLAAGAASAIAQITVDTNDVKTMYAVGTAVTYHNDTLTTSLNIGAPGSTSWDFSGLKTSFLDPQKSLVVASTPYTAGFPQATHALVDSTLSYAFYYTALQATVTLKGIGFGYYSLKGNLLNLGRQGAGNGYLYGVPVPAQGAWTFTPPSVDLALPLEINKTWTTDFTESISGSYNLPGWTAFGPLVTVHDITYTVDAYGTLTLPGAHVQPALRIRKVDRYGPALPLSLVRVGYIYLAKNGASVQFTAYDTLATSGTVSVTSVQWTYPTATSVPAVADVPSTFGLNQNYPNPFNPATTIGYTIAGTGTSAVRLAVYDALGREVALLVDEQKPAGTYQVTFDGSRLASGIYHYRLTSAGETRQFTETKSMILIK
jgi:hypothetical protein